MKQLAIAKNFHVPVEAVTQTFAILAKRGMGKSYTAAVLAEEILEAKLQLIILDPVGVFWGLRSSADGKGPGYPIIVMGGDHGDVPLEAAAGAIIADFVVDSGQSCVIDLSLFRKGEQSRFVTDLLEHLYHRNRAPLHVIMDEADAFAPQRPMHGQERLLGAVEDIVRRGRARGLGVTLVTQRAAVLNKDVLTQAEVLVALRTIAPQDREAIDAWIKVHGTPEQRAELMDSLPSLPIGTAWFWSPGWLDVFKRVEVRRRRTFDSSATPKVGQKVAEPKHMAAVDLKQLSDRIAATIEKAKAEDPRELRRRIAELERQVAARPAAEPKVVEVPVLKDKHCNRLEGAVLKLQDSLREIVDAIAVARVPNRDAPSAQVRPVFKRDQPFDPKSFRGFSYQIERTEVGHNASFMKLPKNHALPPGERAILQACIQYPSGVRREQLTVLTGYKRSSRDSYIARLASRGFVVLYGDRIAATDSGREALPDAKPLPTGRALQEWWMARLPVGEKKILEHLVKVFPSSIERRYLDELTGYKRSSRDSYIARMMAKELVKDTGDGVAASEELFR